MTTGKCGKRCAQGAVCRLLEIAMRPTLHPKGFTMAEQRSSSRHESGRDVAGLDSNSDSWVHQRHADRGPPPQGATGRFGPAIDDRPTTSDAGAWPGQPRDPHYEALRREHERQLDEDYQAWRRHRFGSEFEAWRASRHSTGSSMPGDVTAPDAGREPTEDTPPLFERS